MILPPLVHPALAQGLIYIVGFTMGTLWNSWVRSLKFNQLEHMHACMQRLKCKHAFTLVHALLCVQVILTHKNQYFIYTLTCMYLLIIDLS